MTDTELEYADYSINKLHKSDQSADETDWTDEKTHRYIEKLDNNQIEEVLAILTEEGWIKRYQASTLYSLEKEALPFLKEYGSYSNYYWHDERIKKRKDQKENFDFQISKFQANTKLLPYFISALSLIVAIFAFFREPEQIQQKPILKSEIITTVDSVLTSYHLKDDSLLHKNAKNQD